MLRGTKYDIKRGILTFFYVVILAQFLFSNIAYVVPKNFHMVLNRTSTTSAQVLCAAVDRPVSAHEGQKGFPFAIVTSTDCGESNFYLLAGLLNAVYMIVLSLLFILLRSNVLE